MYNKNTAKEFFVKKFISCIIKIIYLGSIFGLLARSYYLLKMRLRNFN